LHTPSVPGDYSTGTVDYYLHRLIIYNGSYWEVTVSARAFQVFYAYSSYFAAPLPVNPELFAWHQNKVTANNLNWRVTCVSTPAVTMTLELAQTEGILDQ